MTAPTNEELLDALTKLVEAGADDEYLLNEYGESRCRYCDGRWMEDQHDHTDTCIFRKAMELVERASTNEPEA